MASAVGLPAIVVRLPGSNRIQPSYVYLSEREEDDHVTDTPNRIILNLFDSLLPCSTFLVPCSLFIILSVDSGTRTLFSTFTEWYFTR